MNSGEGECDVFDLQVCETWVGDNNKNACLHSFFFVLGYMALSEFLKTFLLTDEEDHNHFIH